MTVLHKGWTKCGVHYIGLCAIYNQVHIMVLQRKTTLKQTTVL